MEIYLRSVAAIAADLITAVSAVAYFTSSLAGAIAEDLDAAARLIDPFATFAEVDQ